MKKVLNAYCRFLKGLLTLLMIAMLVPVFVQILSRHTGIIPRYIWTEEVARFCFVWIVMIGSMIAVKEGSHFSVDVLPHAGSPREKGFSQLIVHTSMGLMAVVFAWYGVDFAKLGFLQTSEMSGINMSSIYISFPAAGVTWLLFLIEKVLEDVRLIRERKTSP